MSNLMNQLKTEINNARHCALSRQNVERVKETIPDIVLCVSCGETLPKGHHIGDRDINGVWEPFCRECLDVVRQCRKFAEEEEDESSWRNRNL